MSDYWNHAAAMIKRHEGYSDSVYLCPAGKKTIGWGHNVEAHPLPPDLMARLQKNGRITMADAEALLLEDMTRAETDCRKLFPCWEHFSDDRKAAFLDWLFNLGLTTALQFEKSVHLINIAHWDEAADEMMDSKWYRQVAKRGPEIVEMIREG